MAKAKKKILSGKLRKTLIIPSVKRVGNYIEVLFHQLKLPKSIFKETRYPHICDILLNDNDEPLIPTLRIGTQDSPMECQGDGRWAHFIPRRVEIILLYDGQEYECGRI